MTQVIQKHFRSKSMNQIPDETVVSKGKLHYLIPDWKQKVKIQNIYKIDLLHN